MYKLALIGKDVSKSLSPQIHNFICKELNIDVEFQLISIPEEQFEDRIEGILAGVHGLNVTIPYKLSIIPHLNGIKDDAQAFGAVNTVTTSNRLGYNTDGMGFMQMLSANGIEVKGRKALVLGAGGAGRSVAKKLLDGGADVEIYDRNAQNAVAVAGEFGGITVLDEVIPHEVDIIINATGVGMHKSEGISPVKAEVLAKTATAVDLIYVPKESEFLRIAKSLGKKTVNGMAMLFYQAYYSDCYYFNLTPDPQTASRLFKNYQKEYNL